MSVGRKSTQRKAGGEEEVCHDAGCGKATPCQKMNSSRGERQGGHQKKTVPKSEFRGPSHPNSCSGRKNCPKLATLWIMSCCWLVMLLRGGINFFLNEVIMKRIVTLTWTSSGWSWKWPDSPQLALHSSFMGLLRSYPPVQHTSSSRKAHTPTFVSVVFLVVLQQKHQRRWPSLPRCDAGQPWVPEQGWQRWPRACPGWKVWAATFLVTLKVTLPLLVVASASLAWHDAVWAVDNFWLCVTERLIRFIDKI